MKTVNLQLARELKEAGYPQEGAFYWVEFEHNSEYEDPGIVERTDLYSQEDINKKSGGRNFWQIMERGKGIDDIIVSPTADEILDQLPDGYVFGRAKGSNEYGCLNKERAEYAETLADAAASMWLYLKKEGLL